MKKIRLLLFTVSCLCSIKSKSQETAGIQFEKSGSWDEVMSKAKMQNKYVFVDCYASWCGPCKKMDKEVYSNDSVGTYINEHFISIKYQFDTSKADDQFVQARYADAHSIAVQYKVSAFPTFLFFSPDGKLVHRDFGYQDVKKFAMLASDVQDPGRQYYTQKAMFQNGERNYTSMLSLIDMAAKLGYTSLADTVATVYYNHLQSLPAADFLTFEKLAFMGKYVRLLHAGDPIFKLLDRNKAKVDSLTRPNFASDLLNYTITNDEIFSKIWLNQEKSVPFSTQPDWISIKASIDTKYGKKYSDSLLSPAECNFYSRLGDWTHYEQVIEKQIKIYPPVTKGKRFWYAIFAGERGPSKDSWALNGAAWRVFQSCSDRKVLESALRWSNLSIKIEQQNSPDLHQYLDTKANILYKLRRKNEAIETEKKAIYNVKLNENKQLAEDFIKNYQGIIDKIRTGEKTW